VINITQRTRVIYAYLKINQMQLIIHKTPKSITTSRLHCA